MVNTMGLMFIIIALFCVQLAYADWEEGEGLATFYGNMKGDETSFGACGYHVFHQGYGLETAAVSSSIFNEGATCGACFEIYCFDAYSDKINCSRHGPITVTATNFCPPSYTKAGGQWCKPELNHFALSEPMFRKIGLPKAELLSVQFKRVHCGKKGGMKFQIKGNSNLIFVLVYNVGGVGDVVNVKIKGSKTGGWIKMKRNWGQNWEAFAKLKGQSLSFQVSTSDGKMVESENVAPDNWQFGQSFEGKNF